MVLEAKIENPITFKLSLREKVIITKSERLPLEHGAVFEEDYFGFNLIVEKDGKKTTYPTQCRIYGTQIFNGQLYVFEEHKYLSWKFTTNGRMLSNAMFSN